MKNNWIRYIFPPLNANMYLLIKENYAVIVDPSIQEDALKFLRQHNISKVYIILTHEHFDHISGVTYYKKRFNTHIIAHKYTNDRVSNPKNKITSIYMASLMSKPSDIQKLAMKQCNEPIFFDVDTIINEEYECAIGNHLFYFRHIPGHSQGSIAIIMDNKILFSGDSLIYVEETNTRFIGGSYTDYQDITLPYFKSLNKELLVLPGHGESFYLGEVL